MRVTNRSWLALASLATMTVLAMQNAAAAEKVFDKTFPATSGGTLTVDTDIGSIFVKGADVHEVIVHATMTGSTGQLRDFDFGAATDSRGVAVRGQRYSDWWFDLTWLFGDSVRIKFDIQVPRDYHVDLRTSGGAIDAQNLKGNVRGHTSGGRLRLNSIAGDIDVHTSGGSIQAEQLSGYAQLRTSGGSITVVDANAELDVRTSGGSIHLQSIEGKVNARTSGGGIEVSFRGANRGAVLRTSGGSIRVEVPKDFKATIDAHTSGGSVHSDLPVVTRDRSESEERDDRDYDEKRKRSRRSSDRADRNELFGELNGGGPALSASTSGGSIRIKEGR